MPEENAEVSPGKEQEKEWFTFSKNAFPEGSLGNELFPEVLEGRERPSSLLETKLEEVNKLNSSRTRQIAVGKLFKSEQIDFLKEKGLVNLGDLLNSQFFVLDSADVAQKAAIRDRVRGYLENTVAVDTYGVIVARAIYNHRNQTHLAPISVDAEKERKKLVNLMLSEIKPSKVEYGYFTRVIDRFGIKTGNIKTLAQVAKTYGVTPENVRQNEAVVERNLRKLDQDNTGNLIDFLAYRENTIPYQLGYSCQYDMKLDLSESDLESSTARSVLSTQSFEELERAKIKINDEQITSNTPLLAFLMQTSTDKLDKVDPSISKQLLENLGNLKIAQEVRQEIRQVRNTETNNDIDSG